MKVTGKIKARGQECHSKRVVYLLNPAVKLVTTVTDWLTC